MTDSNTPLSRPQRDGTSQAGRRHPALDPDAIRVDERSLKDLLVFAQDYARELRYYAADNSPAGDWSGFLPPDLDELAAFAQDPGRFDAAWRSAHARPHLVLFLTFLKLLGQTQAGLNGLTRRHLDFYYREVLRLAAKPALADRVHVLVELAAGEDQCLLPAGSLLSAGQDPQGNDLCYRTDAALLANQAQVVSLKSLFVKRTRTGLPDVQAAAERSGAGPDEVSLRLLRMALGGPEPGGPLPVYPAAADGKDRLMNELLLGWLDRLLDFIRTGLNLHLPAFRTLMELKEKLGPADKRWEGVNAILARAYRPGPGDGVLWRPCGPQAFERNLTSALGQPSRNALFMNPECPPGRPNPDSLFKTLPEVDDVYDLFRLRARPDLSDFIADVNNLRMSELDFRTLMQTVEDIHKDWRRIYDILRAAAKGRKAPGDGTAPTTGHRLRDDDPDRFGTLIGQTLGTLSFPPDGPGNIDQCRQEVLNLEAWSHRSAEDFDLVRRTIQRGPQAQPWEWDRVYGILDQAYGAKRRAALKLVHEADGFERLIQSALAYPAAGAPSAASRPFMKLDRVADESVIRSRLSLAPAEVAFIQYVGKQQGPTADAWDSVYDILERAQRRARGEDERRVQTEAWEGCYAAPDATSLRVRGGPGEDLVTPRWSTFGLDPERPAVIGFAIASPLLALAQGTRTITLILGLDPAGFERAALDAVLTGKVRPFRFWLSTAAAMVEVPAADARDAAPATAAIGLAGETLRITLVLAPGFPAVEPCTAAPAGQRAAPLLQVQLAPAAARDDATHRALASLVVNRVDLAVGVAGLTQLTLQSDDRLLSAKTPFEPFGLAPVVGASLYLAHPECCFKALTELTLDIEWLGAPDSFADYYQDYSDPRAAVGPFGHPAFQAKVMVCDHRAAVPVGPGAVTLFDEVKASGLHRVSIPVGPPAAPAAGAVQAAPFAAPDQVLDWPRYWQLELAAPDFQHGAYPRAAAVAANRKDQDGKPAPVVLNPPYTPKIKRLTLGYQASVQIHPGTPEAPGAERLYHLTPFGFAPLAQDAQHHLLPQYTNEGELYIGIAGLTPPQDLALLFQLAEGSADPECPSEPVHWSYLNGNRWESLEQGGLVADGTEGLQRPGIIRFALPCAAPGTLLPPDAYWLRAAIAGNSRGVADTVAIRAQAVGATFIDRGDTPEHLRQPLPAERITGFAEAVPAVKAVRQPYSSVGGRAAEQPGDFYTRVAERLRHKGRALTPWDYERMVLAAFPEVHRVKCLPVGTSPDPRLADVITLIVIPDIRGKRPFDPFEPKVAADCIARIERYLGAQTSPLVRLRVCNPAYIPLRVRLGVRFAAGADPGYYTPLLNQALGRYLSPWAYDQGAEIVFGGKVNANLIVDRVERLDYVDYVAGITLFTLSDDGSQPRPIDSGFVVPPDAILVSDRQHVITAIGAEVFDGTDYTGIGSIQVGLDLAIA